MYSRCGACIYCHNSSNIVKTLRNIPLCRAYFNCCSECGIIFFRVIINRQLYYGKCNIFIVPVLAQSVYILCQRLFIVPGHDRIRFALIPKHMTYRIRGPRRNHEIICGIIICRSDAGSIRIGSKQSVRYPCIYIGSAYCRIYKTYGNLFVQRMI